MQEAKRSMSRTSKAVMCEALQQGKNKALGFCWGTACKIRISKYYYALACGVSLHWPPGSIKPRWLRKLGYDSTASLAW